MRGSITCFLFSPEVTHDIKHRHLILALSAADVANEAPGTFRTRAFWAHLLKCVYWSGLCSSVPRMGADSPGQREGVSGGLGSHIWEMEEQSTQTSLLCSYISAPSYPQMTSFHCMENYSSEVCLSSSNQQTWLHNVLSFCFYHHPLGLFSSSIKLSLAFIHLSHRWVKSCNYLQCVRREGVH